MDDTPSPAAETLALPASAAAPQQERTEERRARLFFTKLIDNMPDVVFVKEAKELRYVQWNKATEEMTGILQKDAIGKRDIDMFSREIALELGAQDREVLQGRKIVEIPDEKVHTRNRGLRRFKTRKVPIYADDGEPEFLLGVSVDHTDRIEAEEALMRSEVELRAVQERLRDTIRQLSTPVLPIHDGVLLAPIVGHVDAQRGAELTQALLGRIHSHATRTVILDITGVPAVDASVAGCLVQAIRSSELLGARCVLVGISPMVAGSLVQLGVDLSAVVIRRDLQAGVACALGQEGRAAL